MIEGGTLVLGVGSPLMADDGLGVEAVGTLSARWEESADLHFVDGGVWGMLVMPHIDAADRLLIIDVIRTGDEPGTLIRLERDEIPLHLRTKLSPHQIDLSEVLALAELRGTFPPEAVALGIEPARVEAYEGLSPPVRKTVPALLEAVERQLEAWGHQLRPLPPASEHRKAAAAHRKAAARA
ncbi:MAG: HyaD/HybD family hydrogenase maturation endopeptidase [Gemmatimonadota bacterium]|nr:HyaD/HybD family hydrogenase maturation endopeptidase [Gemmatimonadota bacterium]